MGRKMKGGDDVTLQFRIQINSETQAFHALDKGPVIGRVARGSRRNAPFQLQFAQGSVEGKDRMRGRRVTKLPVLFEPLPLGKQIQAQASSPALAGEQRFAPGDDKGKTGDSFETFVRGGNQEIDGPRVQINRNRSKAAHSIHDVAAAEMIDD